MIHSISHHKQTPFVSPFTASWSMSGWFPWHSRGPLLRIVNSEENIDIRRAAALVIANASSDSGNLVGEPRPLGVMVSDGCWFEHQTCWDGLSHPLGDRFGVGWSQTKTTEAEIQSRWKWGFSMDEIMKHWFSRATVGHSLSHFLLGRSFQGIPCWTPIFRGKPHPHCAFFPQLPWLAAGAPAFLFGPSAMSWDLGTSGHGGNPFMEVQDQKWHGENELGPL